MPVIGAANYGMARPAKAPVGFPFSTATRPFTSTCSTPIGKLRGFA
ncbi:MAG: hypothetical protein HY331_18495 [Chloroflexi bacterium]|nr:hypothetical protein [Chloroflexota bacterium]